MKKLLMAVLAAGALSASAAARDVDFGGGSVRDLVAYTQAGADGLDAPDNDAVDQATGRQVYGMGFIRKDLPNAMWKSFKNVKIAIPDKLDLRPGLTQIENQGSCGSCWAFSLTATHRDGYAVNGKDPGRLSQEWLVEYSTFAAGCRGGYFDSATDLVKPLGQPLYTECPYKSGNAKCAKTLKPASGIKGWFMLGEKGKAPTARDIEVYMAMTNAPISIGVAAQAGGWQSYGGGIKTKCRKGELDHMVNIVGWDNEGAVFDENGNLPAGKGVWMIRNSWGKGWGEQGYMRIKMTGPDGKLCDNTAEEAAAYEFW
ncbi:MAG: hypothetical protein HY952_12320 [Elusimicrobia bacterium]|nr:hypothetical protein [Elusimicrobiota bacterium]